MIEDSPIVKDTRKVKHAILERFGNDIDKYVDYLVNRKMKRNVREYRK